MQTVMFSTKDYDRHSFMERNAYHGYGHEFLFQEARLTNETVPLVDGFPVVCGFVNDVFNAAVLEELAARRAEFTVGLIITLARSIHRAYLRTRANNFALEGLLGFNLHRRTIGVIGTGRIGALVARTMATGFGCRVLAHDCYAVNLSRRDIAFRQRQSTPESPRCSIAHHAQMQ